MSLCFDSFDHKILIKLVEKKIKDKGFIDLLHKALKAGYLFQGEFFSSDSVTSRISIISPIFCNILLHELDLFINKVREDFEVGTRHRVNPE